MDVIVGPLPQQYLGAGEQGSTGGLLELGGDGGGVLAPDGASGLGLGDAAVVLLAQVGPARWPGRAGQGGCVTSRTTGLR